MELLPVYKSEKFKCPHCQVTSQQRWFDQELSSSVAIQILKDSFYGYRAKISHYQQEAIEAFITVAQNATSNKMQLFVPAGFSVATCLACNNTSLWVKREMVYPKKMSIDPPNTDIDDDIKELYQEAAIIFNDSPKGSTALLRLALQKLLMQIGKSGKNINNDIKELVAEGLSPKIQQALDLLRVVGNNAVHPGQIDIEDNSNIALKLFPHTELYS